MNKNRIALLAVGVVGLFAAVGSFKVLTASQNDYLVAAHAITPGTQVSASDFTKVTVKGEIPGAIKFADESTIDGQTAIASIPNNGVVTVQQFSKSGGSVIDQDLNSDSSVMGYTVQADNISGVSPNLHAGDYVNIYGSWQASVNGNNVPVDVQLNATPIKVIDVQLDTTQSTPAVAGVTLALPSDLGTDVDFFTNFGKLHLAQVNQNSKAQMSPTLSGTTIAKALKLGQ